MSRLDLAVCADVDALALQAAQEIAAALRERVTAAGHASLMLTGGSTPERMHRILATLEVPWGAIDVSFGDERAVPPDHADSNFRMAEQSLLSRLATPPRSVLRLRGEADDLEAEASRCAGELPDALDVLLLGVGEDGHVASLFPGHPELDESRRTVVVVRDSPKPPPVRLTITPPVIADARRIFVLAAGAAKADALARALGSPHAELPVRLARRGRFLLDAHAASKLAF